MIPQEKADAVTRGLRAAFGVTEFEAISKVFGGQTNSLVFRIVVRGSPYLLKIIMRTEDPSRHYACMKSAAEAGVAPHVWHTDVEHRISITDFVDAEPLSVSEALVRLPALLRTLHSVPPFAKAPFNTTCTFLLSRGQSLTTGPSLDAYLQKIQAANLFPKAASEEFFARYAELAAVCPYDDADMVSSHNDLFKPDNILFDGHRVWLVDWEAAFLNDRYADLAVVANQLVANDQEELAYLRAYFGARPDEYQLARFHLMQQLTHLFYTLAFLFIGSAGKPVDWNGPVPDFTDYQRRIWAREVDLSDSAVKVLYGKSHWERFLRNARQPRYAEALRIVAGSAGPRPALSIDTAGHSA